MPGSRRHRLRSTERWQIRSSQPPPKGRRPFALSGAGARGARPPKRLLRRLEYLVLPAGEQPLTALLRAVLVEIELDQLDLRGFRRHRVHFGILVRRRLELVDGYRDVLPGRRQHEVHPFARAFGVGTALDDRGRDDLVARSFAWHDGLDRIALRRLGGRVVQERDADRRLALGRGANPRAARARVLI